MSDFLVRPLETVHFGSPRSFAAGEAHRSISEFPPTPFAFQGLVRTQLLQSVEPNLNLDDWSPEAREARAALVGGPDAFPENWQLSGPFPAQWSNRVGDEDLDEPCLTPWVPTPRFLIEPVSTRGPVHAQPVRSTHPGLDDRKALAPFLGCPREASHGPIGGWIGAGNLSLTLTGSGRWLPGQHAPELPPFVSWEDRPGLAVDRRTAAAQHAMLYFLRTLRFEPGSGFYGRFHGTTDPRIPRVALARGGGTAGRKGRPVAFEPVDRLDPLWDRLLSGEHLPNSVRESDGFWLVLLTPALIEDPENPVLLTRLPSGLKVKIHGALTGPPIIIGGYSMATGQSRSNRGFTPAGSVWWFSLAGGDATSRAQALRELNDSHALGSLKESAFGFGHCLVGLGPSVDNGDSR